MGDVTIAVMWWHIRVVTPGHILIWLVVFYPDLSRHRHLIQLVYPRKSVEFSSHTCIIYESSGFFLTSFSQVSCKNLPALPDCGVAQLVCNTFVGNVTCTCKEVTCQTQIRIRPEEGNVLRIPVSVLLCYFVCHYNVKRLWTHRTFQDATGLVLFGLSLSRDRTKQIFPILPSPFTFHLLSFVSFFQASLRSGFSTPTPTRLTLSAMLKNSLPIN